MKRYLSALALLAILLAGCKEVNPTPDPEPTPEPPKPTLVAPTNLHVDTPDGIKAVLSWENESTDYDGVEIQKAGSNGKYKMMGNVPAGTLSYTDEAFTENGSYSYRLCSFKGNTYSDYATIDFAIEGIPDPTPKVRIDKVDTAPNMIVVRYTITEDLGNYTENGIVWSATSTAPVLGTDDSFRFWRKRKVDGTGVAIITDPAGPLNIRAYAKSTVDGSLIGYSDLVTASPAAEPGPYNVTYTDITPTDVPSEIKVYKAHTEVTGHPLNIWYAIADLSTGNVVLRTLCPNGYAKTSEWAKSHVTTPYVFTNGGYFYTTSLSYVLDQGVQKAENDYALARADQTYQTARGVFGVTSTGETSVCWRYGGTTGGGPYFYDTPVPQIEGATPLKPSATYPSPALTPGYYSAIGGGPVLVKDGKTRINFYAADETLADDKKVYLSNFELFYTDIYNKTTRQPRTAIGRTADGKVVLMVVDGRNTGVSEGVILTDLARLMQGVGCTDVLNLDGGGSSVFCAGQNLTILNRPSSNGAERSVISMVGFAKPE